MTEKRESGDRRSPAAVVLLVVLFLLPIVYVLSIGPVNWLVTNDYLDSDGPRCFYYPLIYLAENNDTAAAVFVWYVGMFGNV